MNKTKEHKYTEKLERELTSLEKSLLKTLRQRLNRARSVSTNDPTEFMDMASDGEIDDFAARVAESDSATIDEIEEALRLLQEGEYGICQHCGGRISEKRMTARPFSTRCISCKQKMESSGVQGSEVSSRGSTQAYADVENNDSASGGVQEEYEPMKAKQGL